MKNSILLSHVFIDINEFYKKDIVDLCVSHYRKNNPNSFIVLTGHGMFPHTTTLDLCDEFFWSPKIYPTEINVGHPKLVNIGINILKKNGYKKFCKSRLDSIILREKITNYCDEIIVKEKSKKLITTTNNFGYLMGDLFLYGDIDFIKSCWDISTWYPTATGLESLGKNFLRTLNINFPNIWRQDAKLIDNYTWLDLLREYTSYRDPENLKWIDLRSNWQEIFSIRNYKDKILNNDFPYKKYIWKDWPMSRAYLPLNEKIFYNHKNY